MFHQAILSDVINSACPVKEIKQLKCWRNADEKELVHKKDDMSVMWAYFGFSQHNINKMKQNSGAHGSFHGGFQCGMYVCGKCAGQREQVGELDLRLPASVTVNVQCELHFVQ